MFALHALFQSPFEIACGFVLAIKADIAGGKDPVAADRAVLIIHSRRLHCFKKSIGKLILPERTHAIAVKGSLLVRVKMELDQLDWWFCIMIASPNL